MTQKEIKKIQLDYKNIDRNFIKQHLKKGKEGDIPKIAIFAKCSKSLVYKVLDGKKDNPTVLKHALVLADNKRNEICR